MKLSRYKLTRKAHAKLNLFLEVTGKRADGYHELYSLVVFLDLADDITVEPAPTISVIETGSAVGITDNIIYKTATLLAKEYEVKSGAKITFTKNIPIGGGLGGGSADAAATLTLLNKLWDLNLSHDEMYGIALELGADVPVCLYSILENKNTAIFKGIGEAITAAPKLPVIFFTLANPGIELSTEKVFKKFHYEGLEYIPLKTKGDILKNIAGRSNDLEAAAIESVPEIAVALDELATAKNCKLARMTGSGATSFGIFKNRLDARDAAVALIKKHPDWQIGPVGLKKISAYGRREKLKRPLVKKQVRVLKSLRSTFHDSEFFQSLGAFLQKLHIKTRMARASSYSLFLHMLLLVLLTGFIIEERHRETPLPESITVAFAVEDTPAPPPETKLETAAGDAPQEISADEDIPPPVKTKPVVKKKPAAQKAAAKKPTAAAKKPGVIAGSEYGNAKSAPKIAAKDYLELLQYTVQEMSNVPAAASDLRGKAVIHLEFTRMGYVVSYSLKEKSGVKPLDNAALDVAKRLKTQPFPQVPDDFDRGDAVLKYDFLITYPPESKSGPQPKSDSKS